jgi:hypothetical protein
VSLDLFTREVMPAVTRAPGAGGAKA